MWKATENTRCEYNSIMCYTFKWREGQDNQFLAFSGVWPDSCLVLYPFQLCASSVKVLAHSDFICSSKHLHPYSVSLSLKSSISLFTSHSPSCLTLYPSDPEQTWKSAMIHTENAFTDKQKDYKPITCQYVRMFSKLDAKWGINVATRALANNWVGYRT